MANKTFFISGHREITQEEFDLNYGVILKEYEEKYKDNPPKYIMGDYYGVDFMAQNYLMDVLKVNPNRVVVYHMFDKPRNRNNKIRNLVGGFRTDEERDAAMTMNSDEDIAFVRNHYKWSGTGANILRRKLLK